MNTEIYTTPEANNIIKKCKLQVKENPGYRLGQALWNVLPNDVAGYDRTTNPKHYEFYNTHSHSFATTYFYDNFTKR